MKQFARNHEQSSFQFGAFELDPHFGELRKHGIKLKLQHQPLQILTILLERPGEIVTREEIQKRLWPDNTHVDFENAINSAMRKLRDALGDAAENPRFIETLARRGYRFIYPIPGGVRPLAAARPEIPRSRHGLWWAGLSAFLLVTIGLSFWIAKSKNKMSGPETPGIYRFTSYPGVETMPAFSPDGKEIAYVRAEHDPFGAHLWRKEVGHANIYIKLVGAATELRLTNPAGADYYPAWSPDGQYIAFCRDEAGASGIYVVSALGGQERRITYEEEAACTGLAWLPDGRHLVLSRFFEGSHPSPLVEISVDTGKERSITSPPAEGLGDVWPAISPDKNTLAFVRFKDSRAVDACFAALHGNSLRCWPLRGDWPQGLTWTASGDGIIVSAIRTGPYQLWRYGLNGGAPAALTSGEDDTALPTTSSEGNHLAYVLYQRKVGLWEVDTDSSGSVNPAQAKPVA
jgi:DNA-binding winged helix-turn-helix (wHTH) protein